MIDDKLRSDMIDKHIDIERTLEILDGINSGSMAPAGPIRTSGLPAVDGKSVMSLADDFSYRVDARIAPGQFAENGHPWPAGIPVRHGVAGIRPGEPVRFR